MTARMSRPSRRAFASGLRRRNLFATVVLAGLSLMALIVPERGLAATTPPPPPPAPPPQAPPQPYDTQLLRLSEILGSLSYLTSICDSTQRDPFRAQMQALIDTEANASPRREEFAGAYNRGYRGLASTYARCTDNARALIRRFREEGVSITRQVRNLYGGG
ncbi:MAG: TIGR02301 family protein [Hyphomicrobiales bacterium]|nr:TIGR02301 family protein [Hyphomicrobiales bacterium]